jgi:ArsR family transcriptional regulator
MQSSGILSRRKEGVKIFYALKYPEVLEILDLASAILKKEISGKSDLIQTI